MTGKGKKKLRSGFTTGTAAAAAAKGGLMLLIEGQPPAAVQVALLTGKSIRIPVLSCRQLDDTTARCAVIKDAGDDPDITHNAEIGATIRLSKTVESPALSITGGAGVGRVTKPGLDTPVGEPAITRGPRRMIEMAVNDVLNRHQMSGAVEVIIDVPDGERLAKKTLNARLGILGGISILGTTGVVRPLSHDAYVATIDAALSVAKAVDVPRVVLTTGRRSERFSQQLWANLPDEAFIQIGDFFRRSLEKLAELQIKRSSITVFFGKAVKMAQGIPHTHAAKSRMTLQKLAQWALAATGDQKLQVQVAAANTARHALDFILPDYPEVVKSVGDRMVASAQAFAGPDVVIHGLIYGFDGGIIYDSDKGGVSI